MRRPRGDLEGPIAEVLAVCLGFGREADLSKDRHESRIPLTE
jgi:hypothetical protein